LTMFVSQINITCILKFRATCGGTFPASKLLHTKNIVTRPIHSSTMQGFTFERGGSLPPSHQGLPCPCPCPGLGDYYEPPFVPSPLAGAKPDVLKPAAAGEGKGGEAQEGDTRGEGGHRGGHAKIQQTPQFKIAIINY